MNRKVCACVLRRIVGKWHVLAFTHPLAGAQLPKGTVLDGESDAAAVIRELREESGIADAQIVATITGLDLGNGGSTIDRSDHVNAFSTPITMTELPPWILFHVETARLQESWSHNPTGGGEETTLTFEFFWHDLDSSYHEFDTPFQAVISQIRGYAKTLCL